MRLSASLSNPAKTLAIFALLVFGVVLPAHAQRDLSGETKMRFTLDELDNLGSVLMIAAHPDDENTALLAYLARGKHVRTGYLSLTRGEGGQNLIGPEQGDELGIIRTEELLAARRIDGAEQFFTRAIDFGFTKTADETLGTKWPREKVLGDVVWGIRRFRPDVIILRFTGTPRDGHGQHQASAILAKEAFSAAADPKRFPEQLKYVQPWQALRLMTNLAGFTPEQQKEIEKIPEKVELDLGAYSPELGYSYNEIAGMSRSQHRSQAMGTAERKGVLKSYLVTDKGDKAATGIFDNINIEWSRVEGGAQVSALVEEARKAFEPAHPERLLPALAKLRPVMAKVAAESKNQLAERKLAQLDETIAMAAGVWVDAVTDKAAVTPGGAFKITLTALSRNPGEVTLEGAKFTGIPGIAQPQIASAVLVLNKASQYPVNMRMPETQPYTQPYWLLLPKQGAMYDVSDSSLIGNPENDPVLSAEFRLKIDGTEITLTRPVTYRHTDKIYGELTRPFVVVPPVGIEFGEQAMVFADAKQRRVEIPVKATIGKTSGELHLELPPGWKADPAEQHFDLSSAEEQTILPFTLTPPSAESIGELKAVVNVGDRTIMTNVHVIDYPHFPAQTLFPPAEARLVRADIKTLAHTVGYIVGAGDEMPAALRQIGLDVTTLSADDLTHGDLAHFDAIVTGVRSFNTRPDLRANYPRLFKYVEDGGTLVVQYNTPDNGGPGNPAPADTPALQHIGPYPIRTGRDRTTVEESPVFLPNPQLPLFHVPNQITERDFDGWIQERGLNFPSEWDPRYLSVMETHDPGDKASYGAELFTRYGKGAYVMTSMSWFRQLPSGVPGAYRLFANMLSAGKALSSAPNQASR